MLPDIIVRNVFLYAATCAFDISLETYASGACAYVELSSSVVGVVITFTVLLHEGFHIPQLSCAERTEFQYWIWIGYCDDCSF